MSWVAIANDNLAVIPIMHSVNRHLRITRKIFCNTLKTVDGVTLASPRALKLVKFLGHREPGRSRISFSKRNATYLVRLEHVQPYCCIKLRQDFCLQHICLCSHSASSLQCGEILVRTLESFAHNPGYNLHACFSG